MFFFLFRANKFWLREWKELMCTYLQRCSFGALLPPAASTPPNWPNSLASHCHRSRHCYSNTNVEGGDSRDIDKEREREKMKMLLSIWCVFNIYV